MLYFTYFTCKRCVIRLTPTMKVIVTIWPAGRSMDWPCTNKSTANQSVNADWFCPHGEQILLSWTKNLHRIKLSLADSLNSHGKHSAQARTIYPWRKQSLTSCNMSKVSASKLSLKLTLPCSTRLGEECQGFHDSLDTVWLMAPMTPPLHATHFEQWV